MEFVFETEYGQKATAAMARVLRKTLRRKHSRRSHIFGWVIIISLLLQVILIRDEEPGINPVRASNCAMIMILFPVLVFEDKLNGCIARKRMLKGTERVKTTFREGGYYSETEIGNTEWQYDKIEMIAETPDYFVFVFSPSHAQLYDKNSLTDGSAEEFREFIKGKTGKEIVFIR